MQVLSRAGLVRSSPVASPAGGVVNWYRLTVDGFCAVYGNQKPLPRKSLFEPIKISRQEHTLRLAEVIVHTLWAAHRARIDVDQFMRENELRIEGGSRVQYPDCFVRLTRSGRHVNVMFELDNGTKPLDSGEPHSIREKILTYEAHQDYVIAWCAKREEARRVNPRFRVVFLTRTAERAEHIVALAGQLARNRDWLLSYSAPFDDYIAEADALRAPLFIDHHGRWQGLVNTNPTSAAKKTPIRFQTA